MGVGIALSLSRSLFRWTHELELTNELKLTFPQNANQPTMIEQLYNSYLNFFLASTTRDKHTGILASELEPHQYLYMCKYVDQNSSAQLPCWPSKCQQVLHQR